MSSRIALVILVLLLKGMYDLAYTYLVSPRFSWTPTYFPLTINLVKVIESYILTLVVAAIIPRRVKSPSDFLIAFFGTAVILPMLTIYGLGDRDRVYTYMAVVTFAVVLATVRVFPRVKIRILRGGSQMALTAVGLLVVVVIMSLIQNIGLSHFIVGIRFWDYPSTLQAREFVQARLEGSFVAYMYFWLFIVFIPVLIVVSLAKKQYIMSLVLILLQLLLTGITARRHTVAVIPVLLGTYIISGRRHAIQIMVSGFIVIVAVSMLLSIIADFLLVGTWMERFFFVPPRVNFGYYEFFSENGYVYLSSTKLPVPVEYPFESIPERMVGQYIFLNPDTVASGGFLATSYMHFGVIGMIIFGIIVGLLFKLTDALCLNRMPLRMGTSLATVLYDGLLRGADLTTWLLTFGGFVGLIMLYLLGTQEKLHSIDIEK